MLTYANKEMKDQLVKLWHESFGDSEEYILFFYSYYYKEDNILVWMEGKQVIAMIHILEGRFWCDSNGQTKPAYYLYACATKKEYQSKGIFATMLGEVRKKYEPKGMVLLVPVPHLVTYYQKQGMKAFAGVTGLTMESEQTLQESPEIVAAEWKERKMQNNQVQYEICDLALETILDYKEKRDVMLSQKGYIEWDRKSIEFALKEYVNSNGKLIKWNINGVYFYMLCKLEKDTLILKEVTIEDEFIIKHKELILGTLGLKELKRKLIQIMTYDSLEQHECYFNLALDE